MLQIGLEHQPILGHLLGINVFQSIIQLLLGIDSFLTSPASGPHRLEPQRTFVQQPSPCFASIVE